MPDSLSLPIQKISPGFSDTLSLPGSKSLALRQLAMSALCSESSTIHNIPECDDLEVMLHCMKTLGCDFERSKNTIRVTKPLSISIKENTSLDLGMSGVSCRILLAICALFPQTSFLNGHQSLQKRPQKELLDALVGCGATITSQDGKLPITIKGPLQKGTKITVSSHISSQFLTSLLIILPHLGPETTIEVAGELASLPYVDLTLLEMKKRGITVQNTNYQRFQLQENLPASYSGSEVFIEGDASAASYFAAMATLYNGKVILTNVGTNSAQSDMGFIGLMQEIGANVTWSPETVCIEGSKSLNIPEAIDFSQMPDTAPTFMAMTPFFEKPVLLTGLHTLNHKECNRIVCPATELRKLGLRVEYTHDSMKIYPHRENITKSTLIETYDDHRMAMSFALTGLSDRFNVSIKNPGVVGKTYNNFWKDLAKFQSPA